MSPDELPPIGGYVLAGGKSSRMGRDKAFLELGGKPLVHHAVAKLRQLCADASILGSNSKLEAYAPLVRDLHDGCGPMAGIEAALRSSQYDWNLILPVDVPFLPAFLLNDWLRSILHQPIGEVRLSMLAVDNVPHPALLIIHREIAPCLTASLERGDFKLLPALRSAAEDIAARRKLDVNQVFVQMQLNALVAFQPINKNDERQTQAEEQSQNWPLWFANLNTPEEFRAAESFAGLLEKD